MTPSRKLGLILHQTTTVGTLAATRVNKKYLRLLTNNRGVLHHALKVMKQANCLHVVMDDSAALLWNEHYRRKRKTFHRFLFGSRLLRSPVSEALRSQTMTPLPNTRRGLTGLPHMRFSSVYRRAEGTYPLFTSPVLTLVIDATTTAKRSAKYDHAHHT